MTYRRHQYELIEMMKEIEAGTKPLPKIIAAHVCCGGGKQALAGIAAHYLIERMRQVQKFCWVVPNGTLRRQAAESLRRGEFLSTVLSHHLEIYESINDLNPSKDKSGYAITYQALAADKSVGVNSQAFDLHDYLLVLDEPHHIPRNSAFHAAVWPLVRKAKVVLLMSGTLDRHDRERIYLLDYGDDNKVQTRSTDDFRWIRYNIEQGTRDRALIRVHFKHIDARWRYMKDGDLHQGEALKADRAALFTALRTEYASMLLRDCLEHWASYRRGNPRSKLLVVCADTRQAQKVLKQVQAAGFKDSAIATYQDSDAADDAIRRFKQPANSDLHSMTVNVLVTVQMAYEGLDVPEITHLAALTHIRSRPWIEQMIARAWRNDHKSGLPWEMQIAYIWAPDDDLFQECIRQIEQEQQLAVKEDGETESLFSGWDREAEAKPLISPIESGITNTRASELGGMAIAPDETRLFEMAAREAGLAVSAIELKRAVEALERLKAAGEVVAVAQPTPWKDLTPQQRIEHLRRELDALVGNLAWERSGHERELVAEWKVRINRVVMQRWKPRGEMSEGELKAAIQWIGAANGGAGDEIS